MIILDIMDSLHYNQESYIHILQKTC